MSDGDIISKTVLVLCVIGTLFVPLPIFAAAVTCQGVPATIIGTEGDDILIGTPSSDVIVGLGGNDKIAGFEGDDIICGDDGDDIIYGYLGDDVIYGGNGYDVIHGGPDNDNCISGEVNYLCEILNGINLEDNDISDTTPPSISITSPSNGASVSGIVTISATASDNIGVTKVEFYFDGVLIGSDTTNEYTISLSTNAISNGSHVLTAKAYDAADNFGVSNTITVNVNNVVPEPSPPPVSITCQGVPATIIGTPGDDSLKGTEGNDVIHGLEGNDGIQGYGGDDIICGGDGNDNIYGSSGNDIIDGGNGMDSIYGNSGDDILYGGNERDLLNGGSGDDALYGGDGSDFLDGGAGNDTCVGEYKSNCP